MTVLAPDARAVVEPLAVVQEGQIAGAAVRVPLDCVDLWGGKKRGKTFESLHAAGESRRARVA